MTSTRFTTIFEQGQIVVAPFPHVERGVVVVRPALVLTRTPVGPAQSLIWVAMITNALHEFWPGDVEIPEWSDVGLRTRSKVRTAKLTIAETASAKLIGRLKAPTLADVKARVRANLGL